MKQKIKPTVMFFYAGWCGPSQAFTIVLKRALEPFSVDYLPMECYDTDVCDPGLLARWKVDGVPTTIIVSGEGKELGRLVGYNQYDHTYRFLRNGAMPWS